MSNITKKKNNNNNNVTTNSPTSTINRITEYIGLTSPKNTDQLTPNNDPGNNSDTTSKTKRQVPAKNHISDPQNLFSTQKNKNKHISQTWKLMIIMHTP